jgi:hypothetical protein
MNDQYPGTSIAYLDAGFPFLNGFPLLPHLSHNDGRKLDLAFLYKETSANRILSGVAPTFMGYGSYEEPVDNEPDMPSDCEIQGYWQYGILGKFIPRTGSENITLDTERTKALVYSMANNSAVEKIFIEPHLKIRMGLNSSKVRFHGCQAVRHDDHIHVQIH